jgi:hypothetical protein
MKKKEKKSERGREEIWRTGVITEYDEYMIHLDCFRPQTWK